MLAVLPLLPAMPTASLRPAKKMRAPTQEAVDQILDAASPEVRLALEVAMMLGTRAGEIRALLKSQVDLEAGTVIIDKSTSYGVTSAPKGGVEQTIPIDPRLIPLLKERLDQIGPNDHVCVDASGKPWTQWALGHQVKKLKKKLGLTFDQRVHAFRHFFAVEIIQVADLKTTSMMLRHANIATTDKYLNTTMDRMKAATEALATKRRRLPTAAE